MREVIALLKVIFLFDFGIFIQAQCQHLTATKNNGKAGYGNYHHITLPLAIPTPS